MKDFKQKLLEHFKLTEEDYDRLAKDVSLDDLPNFLEYKNIEECANHVHELVEKKEKILIYGDYDCDGIMSTSIMYLTLKTNDYKPGFYIPFRETDGYGLTIKNIDKFFQLGYKVLILVDNGIKLNKEIEYANSLGMEVIVLDHHINDDELPSAKFILHPTISGFSNINMSAGTVCLFFSIAYLGLVDEYLLSLGAISTISDLMPLRDKNRIVVQLGLKAINKNKYLNISLLINKKEGKINEKDISMLVAPKVNAIGRLVNDNSLFDIVRYFINFNNEDYIYQKAKWIEFINSERKQMVSALIKENKIDNSKNSIVIVEENIKEGLTGLLANKFMQDYKKPTVILVEENIDHNIYKGSLRSKNGFSINIILEDLKDILLTYGGHENAGGLSLKKENLEEFKERFEKAASLHPFLEQDDNYIEINLAEITKENYEILYKISPFGYDFEAPKFIIRGLRSDFLKLSRNGEHIYTKFNPNATIVYFNYDKSIFDNEFINLIGELDLNSYNGQTSAQFKVLSFSKII